MSQLRRCAKLRVMRILCVLVMALVVARDGFAQDATRLEQAIQTAVTNRTFSGAVLVARGSAVVLSKGYGLGGIEGFNTAMAFYPETQTVVIVLANMNGPAADQLSASLGAVAHGETMTLPAERTAISLPASALAKYVGQVQMAPGVMLTVSANGEQLLAQLTGQGSNAIFPESDRRFFLKVVDAQLEFFVDASGEVTHLVLYQNGRELKGLRR